MTARNEVLYEREPATPLARIVRYAHDTHLSRQHPDAENWQTYEGCEFCSVVVEARAAAEMPTARVVRPVAAP